MVALLRLWFGLAPVSRRAYARSGVSLMAGKYAVEALVLRLAAGVTWTPLDYLGPIATERARALEDAPAGLLLALGLWSLPFVWIGANMSLKRAVDAGLGPWLGLLFFCPFANYAVMLVLACLPSAPPEAEQGTQPALEAPPAPPELRAALLSLSATTLVAAALFAISVYVTGTYGSTLFLGLPFLAGGISGFVYNRGAERSPGRTLSVAWLVLLLGSGLLLLFALEGLVCIALALGIALPMACLGALLGRQLARSLPARPRDGLALALAAPVLLLVDRWSGPAPEIEVASAVEIDAPPEAVWPHVVGFADLPRPRHWLFATGIAYPVRAAIVGEGVGAVRRCEFSTGAFVEPITRWEPPRVLSFDVRSQPEPMEEWSFYRRVHPPHLSGTFRARRGEFRLVELGGGRTRLEGSTWYELELAPLAYWRLLADGIVHRIHRRVLEHVRALAERGPGNSER